MRSLGLVFGLLVLMVLLLSQGVGVAAPEGSSLTLGEGSVYRQVLAVEPNTTYSIGLWIRGVPEAIVNLSLVAEDEKGTQLGFAQVYRGLGSGLEWQPLGVELRSPADTVQVQLKLEADRAGEYWWDSLSVRRVDTTAEGVREFWEEKLRQHDEVFTGLVVDARGLGVERGMSPRIWSNSGQLIYGGVAASIDFISDTGVVGYGTELTGEVLERIAVDSSYPLAIPLFVPAQAVADPARTSVIISDEAAEEILRSLAAYDYLSRFAVVFLID